MTGLLALDIVLIVLAALVLAPIGVFCTECMAAVLLRNRRPSTPNRNVAARPRTAVLIPAHNEQLVIEQTLTVIMSAQPAAADIRVVVVADNCDDATAEIARRAGAEVVVRTDPDHRGKGYALQSGLQALRQDPPDVVVVIDADCQVEPHAVDKLSRLAWTTQRPVQGVIRTDGGPGQGPVQAVSVLANRFGNLIRPLGLSALGVPCRMTGIGMALPWRLADGVGPSGDSLVEDMQLGIDLTLRGHLALFCPEASISSELPPNSRAFVSQRIRWDHGHLHTAATQIPPLLGTAFRRRSWPLLGTALDLSIPPLTLLMSLWLVATIAAAAAWRLGASWLPMAMLAGGGAALATALGLGWLVFCRRQVSLRTFAAVPFYMLRKMPIYARLLCRRQRDWVRTERGATVDAPPAKSFTVLGVRIRNFTRQQAVERVDDAIRRRADRPASVFFVNAHTLNQAAADPSYRSVLNAGDFVFGDGTGVRWAARLQGVRVLENLVGTDLVPTLFRTTAGRGYSYFLLGADAGSIALAADYARRTFPGWTQAGYHHGYLTDDGLLSAAIDQINAARPDVLLVGMGNPLQERWIHQHLGRLNVGVCLGIGGLFDHWAGNISRAPRWLLRLGHEWLWLLCQQPRQKARRYLVGNPLFLARILRERWGESRRQRAASASGEAVG